MTTPLLRLEQIEQHYADRMLLSIDTLDLHAGECVLVSGNNGAGKTILLKIIAGLLVPDHAHVYREGRKQSWRQARRDLLRQVVYLHQSPYMLDTTVSRNVGYGLRAARLPRAWIGEEVMRALRLAGLDHLARRNARLLSDGEQRRVALTRARLLAPPVMALDEPTTHLDRAARERTLELIAGLRDEGAAVIIASHDVSALAAICDRHLRLEAGHLVNLAGAVIRDKITLFRTQRS